MSPGEVLAKHNSREISEWMAYARIEPFGAYREDWRSASIACVVANANRDPKKRPTAFTVDDFMPKFETPEEPSADDTVAFFEQLTKQMGGEDKRPKGV